jgi:hypothetical protein
MIYDCSYDPGRNVIEVVTQGKASGAELREMAQYIAGLGGRHPSANLLIDHSNLDAGSLTMDAVGSLSNTTASLKDTFKARKIAHVVNGDLQYGLVRAWEIMLENAGAADIETRVFRSRTAAVAWISSSPSTAG